MKTDLEAMEAVERGLRRSEPWIDPDPAHLSAAVALVLREGEGGLEMLFIRRAEWDGDPWSGDLAFPGGRLDPEDRGDLRRAAERETLEELELDLSRSRRLGRLSDVLGRAESIRVSCFVYGIGGERPRLSPNHEIREAFWTPLADLRDPSRQLHREFRYRERGVRMPALRLLEDERAPVLWGITYKLLEDFMARMDQPIPFMPWDEP
ncbi:MAG: NUDIX hydrolase [bacterium]